MPKKAKEKNILTTKNAIKANPQKVRVIQNRFPNNQPVVTAYLNLPNTNALRKYVQSYAKNQDSAAKV